MMEETNDDQPEMVSHEEAVQAEKEATASISNSAKAPQPLTPSPATLAAPSPLPAFLSQARTPTPKVSLTPSIQPSPMTPKATPPPIPASMSRSFPTTPVSKASSPSPPEAPCIPHEESSTPVVLSEPDTKGGVQGLFGWISGHSLVHKVVEKTKSSMESVITTLDPGMRGMMHSGGDIEVALTSTAENKVTAVREAFQNVFGKATVTGHASQATTAAQPVGYTAGLKGAEERISNLKKSGTVPESQTMVSLEGFVVEILPDRWFEMTCLVLKDPAHGIDLQTFSQPTLVPPEYIQKAQDKTPADYPLRWSGLAVSIGAVIEEAEPHIGHADWQMVKSGVSRRQSLLLAAQALAFMYKERLPTSFIS